jgi:hypothetical protein
MATQASAVYSTHKSDESKRKAYTHLYKRKAWKETAALFLSERSGCSCGQE